jgi:hypothetical protein
MSLPAWPRFWVFGGTARLFEIDANIVLHWLMEATKQFQAFSAYFLRGVRLNQSQLDELDAVLRAVRDGSCIEPQRNLVLPGAAVAPAPGVLKQDAG